MKRLQTIRHLILSPLQNEKGFGIFVALLMLVLLTFLGLAAIGTSVTELKIAGNQRAQKQAFLTADAGVTYSLKMGDAFMKSLVADTDTLVTVNDMLFYVNMQEKTTAGAVITYKLMITGLSGNPAQAVSRIQVEIETAPAVGKLEEPGATATEY